MRLTLQRKLVLDLMRESAHTLTAQEIIDELQKRNTGLARATVFRSLDSLVSAGLAQRFERSGHTYAYTACSTGHHHHLVCTSCSRSTEIEEAAVAPLLQTLAAKFDFKPHHASLDFYGVCAECSKRHTTTNPD